MSLPAFQASHSSKDGDGFVAIAKLIAGEDPPRWFVGHLQKWSPSVMIDGGVHAKQFGKAEARTRLGNLSEALELVERELLNDVVATPLNKFGPLTDNAGVDATLNEIARRADVVSSRLDLLGTGLDERLAVC